MEINELWDYILSFTVFGTDANWFLKIGAAFFLVGGIIIFFTGFTEPFLLKGGKLIKYSSNPRKYDEYSGFITILGGIATMGLAIFPLLKFMIIFVVFMLFHEIIFKRKQK